MHWKICYTPTYKRRAGVLCPLTTVNHISGTGALSFWFFFFRASKEKEQPVRNSHEGSRGKATRKTAEYRIAKVLHGMMENSAKVKPGRLERLNNKLQSSAPISIAYFAISSIIL
jgi:hypothetical protein